MSEGEQARVFAKQSKNLDTYLKIIKGLSLWRKGTKESLLRFGQLAQEVIDIEPESSNGYRMLGWYHLGLAIRGFSKNPSESKKKSHAFAQKAVSIDEDSSLAKDLLGITYLMLKDYDKAIEVCKRAVELSPNGARVHANLGYSFYLAGQLDEALIHLKQAVRLNPFPAHWYFFRLGSVYRQKGQYDEALIAFKKATQRNPNFYPTYLGLATTYVFLNRQEEAEAAAKKALELYPRFSIKRASKGWPYKQADLVILMEAMRKAGLPE